MASKPDNYPFFRSWLLPYISLPQLLRKQQIRSCYVDQGNPSLMEEGIWCIKSPETHISPKAPSEKRCWPVSFLVLGNCLRSTFRIHRNTNRSGQASWKSAEEADGLLEECECGGQDTGSGSLIMWGVKTKGLLMTFASLGYWVAFFSKQLLHNMLLFYVKCVQK